MNAFKDLTKFERGLWLSSLLIVGGSYLLAPSGDLLSLIASLVGVTALIFLAKGYVLGEVLSVFFSILYGIISYHFQYYGEMITYLGMTGPIAVVAVITWLRHPYKGSKEVEVRHLKGRDILFLTLFTAGVTFVFYFVLKALGTANLAASTVSIATSVLACSLSVLRSPYYALGYAANDIVLIILWISATVQDPSYLPMVVCFLMFLVNDAYGYYNWRRMRKRQEK